MNHRIKTKKPLLSRLTLFFQNHSVLLFVAFSGCFLLLPSISHAGFWDFLGNTFSDAVKGLLYAIYWFFSILVSYAAELFVWVVDTKTFTALMNDAAIYTVWRTVRDFCNIFFILVLLFSAFATIFQLDRYEWKKTIPLLIIMALLVNFSFPISRFIVDLANVPMYFFAQNTFDTGGVNNITKSILSASNIRDIILPGSEQQSVDSYSFPHLFTAIICMFLFGISFFVLAVLMLVRMIALAILVMFSPIGFVGLITPALHKFAHDWWDKLFKWAFYGPISMMLVLVAVVVMKATDKVHKVSGTAMQPMTGDSVNDHFIASVAYMAIPIVLFWIAITQAEKYSNDMSGLGIKWGSQLGRWGGRTLTGYNWGMRRYGAYSAERKRRSDAKFADSMLGARLGRSVNSALDTVRSNVRGPFGIGGRGADAAKNRGYQEDVRSVDEAGKRLNISNLGGDELRKLADSGGRGDQGAALKELAARGSADRKDLASIRDRFGADSQVVRDFESKMRAFDPIAVFSQIDKSGALVTNSLNKSRLEAFVGSNQFDPKKLSAKSLESAELMQYAFKAKSLSNKDLDELRAKGTEYTNAIKSSLGKMITEVNAKQGGVWNMTDDVQKNMQIAHLSQTGEFHSSIQNNDAVKSTLFEGADGDVLKRIKSSTLSHVNAATGKSNQELLIENIKGKYVDVISKMAETGSEGLANAQSIKRDVIARVGAGTATPNINRLASLNADHRIQHI